jgi:hypothetical protein
MERWPELRYARWKETLHTLHLWTQIVGKIRLKQEPLINHWWNVALYVTPRGLTTSSMPYGVDRFFQIDFDFIDHALCITGCGGERARLGLEPMTVADFYRRVTELLGTLDLHVAIDKRPNEIAAAIPFDEDKVHRSYDEAYAARFWRVLLQADRLCKVFRARFLGKASPVHFFWGSFDLAVTRFSGRLAPAHPGGIPNMPDWATREAYSHEEQSVGFWPGGPAIDAIFYSYIYPQPPGLPEAKVQPEAALWHTQLREFVLPYEAVRTSADPDRAVLEFFQSTYEAQTGRADWDRTSLERPSTPERSRPHAGEFSNTSGAAGED